jgi:hypothetical protein
MTTQADGALRATAAMAAMAATSSAAAATAASATRWYELDVDDRLVACDPQWDVFADHNEGAAARAGQVVGRRLRDFLTDDATLMFVESVLQAARLTGRPRSVAYRCDAPELARRFRMTVVPLAHGHVRVEHELLGSQPRAAGVWFRYAAGSSWLRCSQCLALCRLGGRWLGADLLPRQFLAATERQVDYTVCDACATGAGHEAGA